MKFEMIDKFDFPAQQIIAMLSRGEELCPMDALPNVSHRDILETRREGKKLYSTVEWSVYGQIPKLAQKILTPEMLTVTEKSVWDDDEAMSRTHVIPLHFKDKVTFNITSAWQADADGRAIRVVQGVFSVDIPFVGSSLEKTVVHHLKRNNEENVALVKKHLAKKLGKHNAGRC